MKTSCAAEKVFDLRKERILDAAKVLFAGGNGILVAGKIDFAGWIAGPAAETTSMAGEKARPVVSKVTV